ncbi:unnamed protein product [Malus baccata var. baccata]
MTNAEGLHSRHGVLTRRMARELRLKKEEEEDEKKEKTQEGVEAKEPTVTESPDQNADGVNSAAAADVPVRPQPPPAVETISMGGLPGEARRSSICGLTGTFLVGLGIHTFIFVFIFVFVAEIFSIRPFDHRDEALFQMMCILRMMASIFYRIDDLPDYLIVYIIKFYLQMKEENGKRASSKAGNKNSSERRMMLNANGFHSGHAVLTRRVMYIREESFSLPFVLREAQIKLSSSLYSCYIPSKLIQTQSLCLCLCLSLSLSPSLSLSLSLSVM